MLKSIHLRRLSKSSYIKRKLHGFQNFYTLSFNSEFWWGLFCFFFPGVTHFLERQIEMGLPSIWSLSKCLHELGLGQPEVRSLALQLSLL